MLTRRVERIHRGDEICVPKQSLHMVKMFTTDHASKDQDKEARSRQKPAKPIQEPSW